ncbi:MAG: ABC transporter ATP-binding protein [Anaerolineales bacterium]|nr:MAG: ABC transporter ATP-binding protein [Anaerolineales bacterium]
MSDNYIIKTENLTRKFGDLVAVDGLNLEIGQGEIFGLVGPDGAGKTTTIRMLAAIMDPTEGQATVAGYDTMKQAEAIKHRIGYMAQQFNLYADLSVQENLDFFADIFGVRGRERKERITQLLNFARLAEFTNRRAAHLSGGMKKKLALACSLIHRPEILYLDEPTTGVDPVSRREFWDILSDLHIEGVTILVSTPYMDEAERCSRIGLIYRGQIIVCDTPDRVKGLVEGELIEVRPVAEDRGVGLIRRAEATITSLPGVLEVQTYGDLLHIFVDNAAQRAPQLRAALAAQSIQAEDLRQTHARMEEAFISLIRRQQEEQARTEKSPGGES